MRSNKNNTIYTYNDCNKLYLEPDLKQKTTAKCSQLK